MKQIQQYPYYVNEQGQVFREGSTKPLKEDIGKKGYARITMCVKGKKIRLLVHRIVATAYHPNPNNLPIVLHKDNNPSNNHKDNVAWGTQSQNMRQCHHEDRCSNLIASEASAKANYIRTTDKMSKLLGDRFIELVHRQRVYVKFSCKCGNIYTKRTDSVMLKRNGLCYECCQDEDIV